jgi:hypothetical protein
MACEGMQQGMNAGNVRRSCAGAGGRSSSRCRLRSCRDLRGLQLQWTWQSLKYGAEFQIPNPKWKFQILGNSLFVRIQNSEGFCGSSAGAGTSTS